MYMSEAKHNYTYYQCENIAKTFLKNFYVWKHSAAEQFACYSKQEKHFH